MVNVSNVTDDGVDVRVGDLGDLHEVESCFFYGIVFGRRTNIGGDIKVDLVIVLDGRILWIRDDLQTPSGHQVHLQCLS